MGNKIWIQLLLVGSPRYVQETNIKGNKHQTYLLTIQNHGRISKHAFIIL